MPLFGVNRFFAVSGLFGGAPEQIVQIRMILQVFGLEIIGPKHPQMMFDELTALFFDKYRTPFILQPPDEAWFNVDMMQKDMLLALEMSRELNVPVPTVAISNELLTSARAMGLAKEDFAIVYKVLARMAGLDM